MTLTLTKEDAYLFRRYVTELEYQEASFGLTKEELYLWKSKSSLWEQTATNYKQQLDLANLTLNSQIDLQNKKEQIIEAQIKQANKKGVRKGAVIATAATLIVCLLIK